MDRENRVALILEDEPLISMDLEMTFSAAGFDVFTVATCGEAERWLDGQMPTIVVLDIKLLDGPSDAVAKRVFAAKIPFIVHSGEHPTSHEDDIFAQGEWVGKPASADLLTAQAMELLVGGKQRQGVYMREQDDRYQEA